MFDLKNPLTWLSLIICFVLFVFIMQHVNNIRELTFLADEFSVRTTLHYLHERHALARFIYLTVLLFFASYPTRWTWLVLTANFYFLALFSFLLILAYSNNNISGTNTFLFFVWVCCIILLNQHSVITESGFKSNKQLLRNMLCFTIGVVLLVCFIHVFNAIIY